jgi:predicted nucleotidyltransferase
MAASPGRAPRCGYTTGPIARLARRRADVLRVYVYGSLATGNQGPAVSDIDVIVLVARARSGADQGNWRDFMPCW